MPTNEQILAAVEGHVTRFGDDREGWLALFAPDATIEDPVGSDIHATPEARGAFWDLTHSLADRIEIEPAGPPRVAGGEAAFGITIVTHLGSDKLALDAIDVMAFDDDGRITSMRAFWDMADMRPYDG